MAAAFGNAAAPVTATMPEMPRIWLPPVCGCCCDSVDVADDVPTRKLDVNAAAVPSAEAAVATDDGMAGYANDDADCDDDVAAASDDDATDGAADIDDDTDDNGNDWTLSAFMMPSANRREG